MYVPLSCSFRCSSLHCNSFPNRLLVDGLGQNGDLHNTEQHSHIDSLVGWNRETEHVDGCQRDLCSTESNARCNQVLDHPFPFGLNSVPPANTTVTHKSMWMSTLPLHGAVERGISDTTGFSPNEPWIEYCSGKRSHRNNTGTSFKPYACGDIVEW